MFDLMVLVRKKLIGIICSAILFCFTGFSLNAGTLGGSADLVLGQPDYTHGAANSVKSAGLDAPYSVAFDTNTGRAYVCDSTNNRVLWWDNSASLASGQNADGVLGQPDMLSNTAAITRAGMSSPQSVFVDSTGNVYIASRTKSIEIYSPAGERIGQIEVPQRPTNLCFGGKDGKTLLITTIPAAYTIRMRVKGR